MPLPLLWLGAGLAAAYATSQWVREQQKADGHIRHFPGEHAEQVKPVDGALVCCGIYGLFQHTGIWLGGNIIELKGNGLVRGISPERFLHNRSGERIYIACHSNHRPLVDPKAAARALARVYSYSEYDVLNNNCHRFVYEMITGEVKPITRFGELNAAVSRYFSACIHWQPMTACDNSSRLNSASISS
ncbi:hypothetical protein OCL06_05175 [Alteromonas sp. ASW11-19]|uniref:LRAT domain-containing protein n=1 Tax=Alteromonas salexigens TaxID=2982530 RepID=A0ABT2VL02_9ALTE|nr:hypothetical protein [Alteromonas salexigens]MCU7553985.1 hypothetical protein [Alteromonas salexigens]